MKLTLDIVKHRLKEINPNVEILSEEYISAKSKLLCKCKIDDYIWESSWSNLSTGKGCPKCSGNIRHSFEEIFKYVEDNSECKLLSTEYVNSSTKLLFKCKCGDEFERSFTDFKLRNICTTCSMTIKSKKRTRSTEQFKNEVKRIVNDEYTVLGEYKKARTKILMRHSTCGNDYEVTPDAFLRGSRCPKCHIVVVTADSFRKEVYELVGNEYTLLDDYVNALTKVTISHNECGHVYKVVRNKFLSGRRCPNCKENKQITYEEALLIIALHHLKPLFTEDNYDKGSSKYLFETKEGYKIWTSITSLKNSKQLQPFSIFNPYTLENIHLYCSKHGGHKCLSTEFNGNDKKLLFKCDNPNHLPYDITFNDFRSGYRCRYCAFEKHSKRMKENNPMEGVKGENHPNYNPSLTDEERELGRETQEYKEYKKKVRMRDNYRCRVCNKRGKAIVHHLNGYHWFIEGRLDIENAVTLCDTCHTEFHELYGRKWNKKEQFEEFLRLKKS